MMEPPSLEQLLQQLPPLDGRLVTGPAELAAAADDFGHILKRAPAAVLLSGSIEDIRKVVRFAREHRISVGPMSMIGNTHSVYGQSQAEAGIVIDLAPLSAIVEINDDSVLVQAGARYGDIVTATLKHGKCLPCLTDYIDLSAGGTLSAGGVGGQTSAVGMLVDNALELDVVTGEGHLVTCSASAHPELFHAVRGGMGQCAIIVRARLRLVPVPGMVRRYTAVYSDLAGMMADQQRLVDDGRFDYLEGFALPAQTGGYFYQIEAAKYFAAGDPPDDAALTSDWRCDPGTLAMADLSHYDFLDRLAPLVAHLKAIGAWALPHPWIDMFVPASKAERFLQSVLAGTPHEDMGGGPILIYPFRRAAVTAPFVVLPDEPLVYLFSLLRFAPPPSVPALLEKNRSFYEALRDLGGKRYAASCVPFSPSDWRDHFGSSFEELARLKERFDPDGILTPGPGIFPQ